MRWPAVVRLVALAAALCASGGVLADPQWIGRLSAFEQGLAEADHFLQPRGAHATAPASGRTEARHQQAQGAPKKSSPAEPRQRPAPGPLGARAAAPPPKAWRTTEPPPEDPHAAGDLAEFWRTAGWPAPIPAALAEAHREDLPWVLKLHALLAPLAQKRTVIVIPTNLGFMNLSRNLLCRLRQLHVSNAVLWALDEGSAEALKAQGIAHFYDPGLYAVSEAVGYGASNEKYGRMMSERPKMWWRILATGLNMFFLDADVVAFSQPEAALDLAPGSADFQAQLDYQARYAWGFKDMSNASTICAGVFFLRSSPKALLWMDRVIRTFSLQEPRKLKIQKQHGRWDDQTALNYLLADPTQSAVLNPQLDLQPARADVAQGLMSAAYLHPRKVLGGTMLRRTEVEGGGYNATFSCKCAEMGRGFRPLLLHFNGHPQAEKIRIMKEHGWWELDEDGNCARESGADPTM